MATVARRAIEKAYQRGQRTKRRPESSLSLCSTIDSADQQRRAQPRVIVVATFVDSVVEVLEEGSQAGACLGGHPSCSSLRFALCPRVVKRSAFRGQLAVPRGFRQRG
jgi:hypothetical protein